MDNPVPVDFDLRLGSLGQAAQVLVESQTDFFGMLPDTIRDHICSNINANEIGEGERLANALGYSTPISPFENGS